MAQCYIACGPRIISFADASYNIHETEIPVLPMALDVLQHVILCLQKAYEFAPLSFVRCAPVRSLGSPNLPFSSLGGTSRYLPFVCFWKPIPGVTMAIVMRIRATDIMTTGMGMVVGWERNGMMIDLAMEEVVVAS